MMKFFSKNFDALGGAAIGMTIVVITMLLIGNSLNTGVLYILLCVSPFLVAITIFIVLTGIFFIKKYLVRE